MADLTPQDLDPASGKDRSTRIRLDHYKGWDTVTALRWLGALGALGLGAATMAWVLSTPEGRTLASHGPLTEHHAAWSSKCEACHTPGVPLRIDTVSLASISTANAQRCQGCHAVSSHHSLPPDSDPTCSSCHQEHRGANANLLRVADPGCTTCHAQIETAELGKQSALRNVAAFPTDHPEFRSLPADREHGDPGTLGFSHSRHMTLGLTSREDSRDSGVFRYRKIPEGSRELYLPSGVELDAPVQLDCSSCHELPGRTGDGRSQSYATAEGGAFLPVNYERHCQACHALSSTADPENPSGVPDRPSLPHGLQAKELTDYLRRELRSQWFDDPDGDFLVTPSRTVPGRSRILRDKTESVLSEVQRKLDKAKKHVGGQCQKCHEMGSEPFQVKPTQVPQVWLPKSWFDHRSHRAVDCAECHPGALPAYIDTPLSERKHESDAVLIPTKENCVTCHSPDAIGGGVRHDCVLCHRYHRPDDLATHSGFFSTTKPSRTVELFLNAFPDARSAD